MDETQQDKILSTCIKGMKITKKNGGLVTDCPFIKIERSVKHTDICGVFIIGSEKTSSSFIVRSFHIGILYLIPISEPFYSSIIPEYSLVGIYRSIKNREFAKDYSCLLPKKYDEEYLEHVVAEFGNWLHQKKMITKEERDS